MGKLGLVPDLVYSISNLVWNQASFLPLRVLCLVKFDAPFFSRFVEAVLLLE